MSKRLSASQVRNRLRQMRLARVKAAKPKGLHNRPQEVARRQQQIAAGTLKPNA